MNGGAKIEWFYALDREQHGPVGEARFAELVNEGVIGADTLVWNVTLDEWIPLRNIQAAPPPLRLECVECGESKGVYEGLRLGRVFVCAGCKPVYMQRLRQGLEHPLGMRYGGFGVRFMAKMLDGIIVASVQASLTQAVSLAQGIRVEDAGIGTATLIMALSPVLSLMYYTYFHGRYGATPGKIAIGLRVVRPDGSPIGYRRALCRGLSEWVSALVLYIGYLMAMMDEERRALHDRMCDTRVVVE